MKTTPLPTNDLRERFIKQFPCMIYHLRDTELHDEFNNREEKDYALTDFLAFIEQEVTRARQDERAKIVKAIEDRIEFMDKDFNNNQPFISEAYGIIELISPSYFS